jgi:hypothetical protein
MNFQFFYSALIPRIRACCREKELRGCGECGEFPDREKLDFLNAVQGDAHRKNLVRIREKGIEAFLKGKRNW